MTAIATAHLNTAPHFQGRGGADHHAYTPGDDFLERLTAAHRGLDDAASRQLNVRLVLLLANHIGHPAVLDEALAAARAGLPTEPGDNGNNGADEETR